MSKINEKLVKKKQKKYSVEWINKSKISPLNRSMDLKDYW